MNYMLARCQYSMSAKIDFDRMTRQTKDACLNHCLFSDSLALLLQDKICIKFVCLINY